MSARRWSLTDLPEWGRQRDRQMSLNDTILSSIVHIVGDKTYANRPGSYRGVIGTGFLCAVPSRLVPGGRYGYVVTAHHVIDGQNKPEVHAPTPTSMGSEFQPPVTVTDWKQPLDDVDLAIADFQNSVDRVYGGLATERHFLPQGWYPHLGGVVHYAGVLEPLNRVMVRSGTLGALYQSGLEHEGGYVYDAHLLDCGSYRGFSGSPCFSEIPMARLTPSDTEFPGDKFKEKVEPRGPIEFNALLCGMLTWHLGHDRQEYASQYGVVAMVTSDDIWRALMSDKEQTERDEADEKHLAALEKEGPKPENLSAGAGEDEYERFDGLLGHLVNTPKPKPDEDKGERAT